MSVTVRRIGAADLEALARLHAQCFPEDAWDATALAGVLAMRGASGRLAIGGDGAMLGFLFDLIRDDDEAEILTFGVSPGQRRRGIARMLLADLFERGRTAGAAAIILEVAADNDPAVELYHSCGFRPVGRRTGYYRRSLAAPVDAWLLRRSLVD